LQISTKVIPHDWNCLTGRRGFQSPIPKASLVDLQKVKAIYVEALLLAKGTAHTETATAVPGVSIQLASGEPSSVRNSFSLQET